jgi:hypothetical protein
MRLILLTLFFIIGVPFGQAEGRKIRKVLFLGDSMSLGAFGKTLDARLREAGLEVYTEVTGGATPYYWLQAYEDMQSDIGYWVKTPQAESRVKVIKAVPKVETLLQKYRPDLVIIQTGVNLYSPMRSSRKSSTNGPAGVQRMIQQMCQSVSSTGATCYWITPPTSHHEKFPLEVQKQLRDIIKAVATPHGRVFDSAAVTKWIDPYPQTDGIHYGPTEAAGWAHSVSADLLPAIGKRDVWAKPSAGQDKTEVRKARIVQENLDNSVSVEIRLVRKSDFKTPAQITYQHAFAVFEYEVVNVLRGNYSAKKIRLAHLVVQNRRIQPCRDWEIGKKLLLEVVPLSNYPKLENGIETIDTLPDDEDVEVFISKI